MKMSTGYSIVPLRCDPRRQSCKHLADTICQQIDVTVSRLMDDAGAKRFRFETSRFARASLRVRVTGSSEVAARRLHFRFLCSQALCTALLVSIQKYGVCMARRGARGACQTPAGQSLVPAVRARARAVRVAAARARRPRVAARPRTRRALARHRPGPDRARRSVARAAAVETEDSHRAAGPRPS